MVKKFVAIAILAMLLCCGSGGSFASLVNDPYVVGVGAKSFGMGKTYMGVYDDISGLFLNPTSMAEIKNTQFTSMSGRFQNDFSYTNYGIADTFKDGAVGIGYVNAGIAFSESAATIESGRLVPISGEVSSFSYSNQSLILSYGIKKYDLNLGAALKVYFPMLSGPGVLTGSASGSQIDVAASGQIQPYLNFGMICQNIFSQGKLKWSNGDEETLPFVVKPGMRLTVLGPNGLRKVSGQRVDINLDGDIKSQTAPIFHLGVEWQQSEMLSLRVGIDQELMLDASSKLVQQNNPTFGIGLFINGFRFDYAYHYYSNLLEDSTQYFSISFGIPRKSLDPEHEISAPFSKAKRLTETQTGEAYQRPITFEKSFSIDQQDKTIVYVDKLKILGQVINPNITKIAINNGTAEAHNDKFSIDVDLVNGKNSIQINGYDNRGKFVVGKKFRILKLKTFKDLKPDTECKLEIEQLATLGYLNGLPGGKFGPKNRVMRINLLINVLNLTDITIEEVEAQPFIDVSIAEKIAPYLKKGYDSKIIKGYPDLTVWPWKIATIPEGLEMIRRFAVKKGDHSISSPPTASPTTSWAVKELKKMKRKSAVGPLIKRAEQGKRMQRSDIAALLCNIPFISKQIDDLMNWEIGY